MLRIAVFFLLSASLVVADTITLPLYPEGQIPNYRNVGEEEVHERTDILRISRVQIPDIQVFLPTADIATGEAIVICPGGGYRILAYELEGTQIADWWTDQGIAAIVLKYRLPTSAAQIVPRLSPLLDAQRALRLVRHHAADWRIDPDRVGIMGFSAGGHLAATASVQFDGGDLGSKDPVEHHRSRPDFSMFIYPVISFTADFAHQGSRRNLLGENHAEDLAARYSIELQVRADSPPVMLIHAMDDAGVPVAHSHALASALREVGGSVKMIVYNRGGHGFGRAAHDPVLGLWSRRCHEWLVAQR